MQAEVLLELLCEAWAAQRGASPAAPVAPAAPTVDVSEAGKYVIVRTYSAGVFAGVLVSRHGQEVRLTNARRIWKWAGAKTLSELAMVGTTNPSDCKFAVPASITLTQAIEILDTTTQAQRSLIEVPIWSK